MSGPAGAWPFTCSPAWGMLGRGRGPPTTAGGLLDTAPRRRDVPLPLMVKTGGTSVSSPAGAAVNTCRLAATNVENRRTNLLSVMTKCSRSQRECLLCRGSALYDTEGGVEIQKHLPKHIRILSQHSVYTIECFILEYVQSALKVLLLLNIFILFSN